MIARRPLTVLSAAALCTAFCGPACADIYRSVDASGTTVFTNVPAPGRTYDVVVREPKAAPASTPPAVANAPAYSSGARARYERYIEAAAKASDVEPALIHAVISAESGYNAAARSKKGAIGLMQLMPETAARYSVRNPLDPAENIHGGARYLRDLLAMFNNDLRLAIAAYNAGEQAVVRYGNRIPPYAETIAYVPKVLSYYRRYHAAAR